ncbi:MAG: F0F1 ATP synthase subunit delta [Candidatus Saccharimonas sp.]
MQGKISRRKLAQHIADELERGTAHAPILQELAAYLVDTKRIREVDLVIRAIEDELAGRGVVLARVTTATELSDQLRRDIEMMIGARQVTIDAIVDPAIVGGIRVETPGQLLDATIQRKLLALRQAKV